MERYAWRAEVLPGMLEEYRRRHDALWPEMQEVLAAAGIRNYTIWVSGRDLFGYYECDSVETAAARPVRKSRCEKMGCLYEGRHAHGAGPDNGSAAKNGTGLSL